MQYEVKVRFMEMLQQKQVSYEDDINMVLAIIREDERYTAAGDRARQWLLQYFTFQRQVLSPYLRINCLVFTCVSYAEARNSYRLDVRLSVRLSVRPSHAGTLSKRLNILSCFLHHTTAHSF